MRCMGRLWPGGDALQTVTCQIQPCSKWLGIDQTGMINTPRGATSSILQSTEPLLMVYCDVYSCNELFLGWALILKPGPDVSRRVPEWNLLALREQNVNFSLRSFFFAILSFTICRQIVILRIALTMSCRCVLRQLRTMPVRKSQRRVLHVTLASSCDNNKKKRSLMEQSQQF